MDIVAFSALIIIIGARLTVAQFEGDVVTEAFENGGGVAQNIFRAMFIKEFAKGFQRPINITTTIWRKYHGR